MYAKLAIRNVKRQFGNYLIYFITVALTVALMFSMCNLIFSDELKQATQTNTSISSVLVVIVIFISLIVAFVLSYANSFMLKLRKREFGTYLTLGMSRKNVLTIFVSESTIIAFFALGLGILLGLFVYQGIMALMMNLLEIRYSFSAYSTNGLIFSIILVLGLFLISSVTSAHYLKKVSIYDLIHADKKVEKTVRHPKLWFLVTLLSFICIITSLIQFIYEAKKIIMRNTPFTPMLLLMILFSTSLILFHIGLAKSLVHFLLQRKHLCSKSTNKFVLRSLSGSLTSSAIMIGCLAFLIMFAVIGANFSFVQKSSLQKDLNRTCPFDVRYIQNTDADEFAYSIPLADAEQIIASYKKIKKKINYTLYTTGDHELSDHTIWSGEGYQGLTDSFIALSDFNDLMVPLGYEPITLNQGFYIIGLSPNIEEFDWNNAKLNINDVTYDFQGVSNQYPLISYQYFYTVVPDEAITTLTPEISYAVYDLEDGAYDAYDLNNQLYYSTPYVDYQYNDFMFREYYRQEQTATTAVIIVGALFTAFVFLFMAMAILALKTLSGFADDKQRFQVLFQLGVSEREQNKTLFRQTFSYFSMPFVLPILLSFPVSGIIDYMLRLNGVFMTSTIYLIAVAISMVLLFIYLIYYLATYTIAKRAVICTYQ